jgi:MFS family permease
MSATAPLRHRLFRLLLAGRTVNALGNSFAPIALAFAVLDLTGSATDLGFVVGARTVVNVAFLLFGGVLADRLPKNLLMVGSSVAAGLTQAAVAALVLTHAATIPLLVGLAAVNGMVGALALPASAAILPQTVPADIRQQANAINRVALNSASVLGAPIAGVVVASVGPGWGIAVDAATFVIAAFCFAALGAPVGTEPAGTEPAGTEPAGTEPARSLATAEPILAAEEAALGVPDNGVDLEKEPGEPAPKRPNVIADLRTGWSEFRSRTWLWVVVAGFCVSNMAWAGGLFVLGPVVADDTIGGLIAMRLRLRRLLYFGVACCLPLAIPVFLLGALPHLWALIAGCLVGGLAIEQFGVAWETTMQEHIPSDKLARVYSYDMVGSFVAIPIGEMAAGPLAQVFGREATLVGAGSLMVVAVLAMLSSRDVRTVAHKLPEPADEPVKESVA